MPRKRDSKSGRFIRQRNVYWDGSDWDDGYIDPKRRFRVYRPDYPRAYAMGYALRSHVVWWIANGEIHKGELHHINGNTLDDRLENLKLMTNSAHQRHHKEQFPVECMCEYCGKAFTVPRWRIRSRVVRFCSQACYHSAGGSWNKRRKA